MKRRTPLLAGAAVTALVATSVIASPARARGVLFLTVPGNYQCVADSTSVEVEMAGANGAADGSGTNPGGFGANVGGTLTVTAGETLFITVGSAGTPAANATGGGGGGGYTSVADGSGPLVVAGGGGGGGYDDGPETNGGSGGYVLGDGSGGNGASPDGTGADGTTLPVTALVLGGVGGSDVGSAGVGGNGGSVASPAGSPGTLAGGGGGGGFAGSGGAAVGGTVGAFGGGGAGAAGTVDGGGAGGGGGGYTGGGGGGAADPSYGSGGGGGGSSLVPVGSSASQNQSGGGILAITNCALVEQSADQVPAPWFQSYGRNQSDTCLQTWSPSWAQWPNKGTGGFTCDRWVSYNPNTGWWDPAPYAYFPIGHPYAGTSR